MSTNSNIAMVNPDGVTATMIYCHWDGYPSHTGRILLEHYSNPEKIKQLLALGNISSLGPELGEEHRFDDPSFYYKGWTTAYGRDRGEKRQKAQTVKLKRGEGWESLRKQEYLYLWKENAWYFCESGAPLKRLLPKHLKD